MNTQPPNPSPDNNHERAYQAYGAVTKFGICPGCGLERPLAADGTIIGHDRTESTDSGDVRTICPGTGQLPATV